ncbi:MAG: carbamoyl-phosphate synthase large subunit [Chthoniobacterales bacterium]|nr:carbamoyl-phosphate synthase large subunit [Chthoniobacterales bacterium]
MPKDPTLKKILLIGAGPIVIGQGCEFDYSGVQACKALAEEGYEVVLVNSNPATIMTDPEFAQRTYIEPITPEIIEKIIEREKPDSLLPTLGGQTALNVSMELVRRGILKKHGVRLIGANAEAIQRGEDRSLFKKLMLEIGLEVASSAIAHTIEEALAEADRIGIYPLIIRPAFTLGGAGGGIARNREELETISRHGLDLSPTSEILIEESLLGWKEFEVEVIRDCADNCIVICSIENIDPMGVHTGDSITVAPIQTLTDKEYQRMRDASFAVIRAVGVETGGSNIQFAVHPKTGRMIVIEMNPRVSRSSALASKATGYPIAKIAAKLAVGYRLDELKNDITQNTTACFEPAIDYCVVKIPRFTFEKFPLADATLTTQMKSVGEVIALGRTFKQSLQKALRSLETGRFGLGADGRDKEPRLPDGSWDLKTIEQNLRVPCAERIFMVRYAFLANLSVEEIHEWSGIDPWFLHHILELVQEEQEYRAQPNQIPLHRAKKLGFSDHQLAFLSGRPEDEIRAERKLKGIVPTYRLVDTCAAEFEASTPYYYSTYGEEDETRSSDKKKVLILGGGPNRIGQGIEFDYCCVHASFALQEAGYETIMVNSNPETVSTDYDSSDKLYFEPLTLEDVLNIYEREQCDAAVVQFGGQTPLNLAAALQARGVTIIGTQPQDIEKAEDRKCFSAMINKLGLRQTLGETAINETEAVAIAERIGYPVLVRPSFVLGGRAMEIVYAEHDLRRYIKVAVAISPERPVLIDRFLEDATEVDVDCLADGHQCVIGGIMEHIEEAGIHSGDSACVIPTFSLSTPVLEKIRSATKAMALELNVRGLMNVQFAVKGDEVYVLEVNPRASRTSPFVSKAIGVPLAKLAAKIMAGQTLAALGFTEEVVLSHFCVKAPVMPFIKFPGTDTVLGPEMRSTGEVMGLDHDLGHAYAKAQMAAHPSLPLGGNLFVSVKDSDKKAIIPIVKEFIELGFDLFATRGTAAVLQEAGIKVTQLNKLSEGHPNVLDMIKGGSMHLSINTPTGKQPRRDEIIIRSAAVAHGVPTITVLRAAIASIAAIRSMQAGPLEVCSIQEFHASLKEKGD